MGWASGAWAENAWTGTAWASQDAPVEVPDVVGQTQASATTELEGAGFVVAVEEDFSDSVALGLVISQQPASGQTANEGSTVTITVSLGVRPKTGGRSRKRQIRYVVEVDGQFLEVANVAEVEAVLANARELAEVAAPRDVKPAVRIKPPRIAVRTASGEPSTSQTIRRAVQNTQAAVNAIYRRAQVELEQNREISRLIHERIAQEDEEDAILALLL